MSRIRSMVPSICSNPARATALLAFGLIIAAPCAMARDMTPANGADVPVDGSSAALKRGGAVPSGTAAPQVAWSRVPHSTEVSAAGIDASAARALRGGLKPVIEPEVAEAGALATTSQ
ncbi:hypothetical protein OSH11_18610 [Kaistia dalseonensis]|uniref:Uncharacterized protein n=1 Tax=Kaistia dalseonensis TaxID=410840 RepID=A0ABU0HAK6_9HYPH|nr:hypothetical protein [Kaistia dalseonensis]MCX5496725.1 hypothetical protein [Kaistia dalseonensis]MDQ0439351.1 hypothetical protein [Kaistia dalseonensis]